MSWSWAARSVGGFAVERHPAADYLADILLLPAYQRRGIGSAVIGALAATARARGVPLALQVLDTNPAHGACTSAWASPTCAPPPCPATPSCDGTPDGPTPPAVTSEAGSRLNRPRTARTPTPRAPSHTPKEPTTFMDITRTSAADDTPDAAGDAPGRRHGLLLLLPMLPAVRPAGRAVDRRRQGHGLRQGPAHPGRPGRRRRPLRHAPRRQGADGHLRQMHPSRLRGRLERGRQAVPVPLPRRDLRGGRQERPGHPP